MTFAYRSPKYWKEMRKLQAASSKPQAPSDSSFKRQAASCKLRQPGSYKLPDP